MATIEEIPIVSEEAQPEETEITERLLSVEEEEEPAPAAPAPKKRGRPAGAKNKAKPKIVARPKKKAPPPPPSDDEEEESDEEPPPPPRRTRSRAAPAPEYEEEEIVDARSVAAEMLQMLSQRHVDRNHAKKQKYASWFPNRAVY